MREGGDGISHFGRAFWPVKSQRIIGLNTFILVKSATKFTVSDTVESVPVRGRPQVKTILTRAANRK